MWANAKPIFSIRLIWKKLTAVFAKAAKHGRRIFSVNSLPDILVSSQLVPYPSRTMPTRTNSIVPNTNSYPDQLVPILPTRTQTISYTQYQLVVVPKLTVLSYCCYVMYHTNKNTALCLPFDYDSSVNQSGAIPTLRWHRVGSLLWWDTDDVTGYVNILVTFVRHCRKCDLKLDRRHHLMETADTQKAKTRKLEKAYRKKPSNESRLAWRAQFADQRSL